MSEPGNINLSEASKGKSKNAKQTFLAWLWRTNALFLWLWLIARTIKPDGLLAFLSNLWWPYVLGISFGIFIIYLITKPVKIQGCIALFLGFPFYFLFFPLTVSFYIFRTLYSYFFRQAIQPRDVFSAFAPYFVTFTVIILIIYLPTPEVGRVVISLTVLNLLFILISLLYWIFSPLSWIALSLQWGMSKLNEYADTVLSQESLANVKASFERRIKNTVGTLVNIHKAVAKFPKINTQYEDSVLVLGFVRKFCFSIIHAGLLFTIIHFILNSVASGGELQYRGLPEGEFSTVWLQYLFFSFITMVTGSTTVIPLSEISRIAVLFNAFFGILFLAILLTAFSMLTRERAMQKIVMLNKEANQSISKLESQILTMAIFLSRLGIMTDDVYKKLGEVESLDRLDKIHQYSFLGVLLMEKVIKIYFQKDVDSVNYLINAKRNMESLHFALLYVRLLVHKGDIDASIMANKARNILEDAEENLPTHESDGKDGEEIDT